MLSTLKKFRVKAFLTQDYVAQEMKVAQSTYQRWETQKTPIPKSKLKQLAEVLGVTTAELSGQPRPFDLFGVDDSIDAERKYYGEIAIHLASGKNLLAPISLGMANRVFSQAQAGGTSLLIETLDNSLIYLAKQHVIDIFVTADSAPVYGPETYTEHLGVHPDENMWHVLGNHNLQSDDVIEYVGESVYAQIQAGLDVSLKPEAEQESLKFKLEKLRDRASTTTLYYSSGKQRHMHDLAAQTLMSAFYELDTGIEITSDFIVIEDDGLEAHVLVNVRNIECITLPLHQFEYGKYLSNKDEID